jgi:hypothetical protein
MPRRRRVPHTATNRQSHRGRPFVSPNAVSGTKCWPQPSKRTDWPVASAAGLCHIPTFTTAEGMRPKRSRLPIECQSRPATSTTFATLWSDHSVQERLTGVQAPAVLGDHFQTALERLVREPGEMRRYNDSGQLEQRVVRSHRFA